MRYGVGLVMSFIVALSTACSHLPSENRGAAPGGGTAAAIPASVKKPVSFSILQDYVKGEDLREVEKDFQLFKELGVTTWRGSFAWGDLEPVMMKYDLEWLHRFADLAEQYGLKLRPYIGYTPSWAAKGGKDKEAWNDPPARPEYWTDFVSTLARSMARHPNILSYEIYNEENVPEWWDGTPEEYNRVLRDGALAIRKVDPSKQIIFGGMVYPDAEWVRKACATYGNGGNFNVIPFHAYPETWTKPEITVENYLDQGYPGHFQGTFIPWADTNCGRKAIWINEAGFATTPGKTEAEQANWWVRAVATFLADPRVEHIGIYQIRERAKGSQVIGGSENYYLGITTPERKKKMAFHMLKILVSLLNTGTITVADNEVSVKVVSGKKGELFHHLFIRPDGRRVLIVWDRSGGPELNLSVGKGRTATEFGLDGKARQVTEFDGMSIRNIQLVPGKARVFAVNP